MDAKLVKTKEDIINTINKIASFMDLECQVELKEEINEGGKSLLVSIYTPVDARFLIGKDGQNLRSFEQVIRAMFLKNVGEFNNIIVDVNDYKKSRNQYVIDLAKQAVTR